MTAMSITILILLFQLESLVLDNNMLTTVVLEVNISHSILLLLCLGILIRSPPPTDHQQPLSRRLRFLSLLGNRLRCDCKVSNHHHHNELNCQIFITTIYPLRASGCVECLSQKEFLCFSRPASHRSAGTHSLCSLLKAFTFHHQHHNHQHRQHTY